jgi:hypothetical protein
MVNSELIQDIINLLKDKSFKESFTLLLKAIEGLKNKTIVWLLFFPKNLLYQM